MPATQNHPYKVAYFDPLHSYKLFEKILHVLGFLKYYIKNSENALRPLTSQISFQNSYMHTQALYILSIAPPLQVYI